MRAHLWLPLTKLASFTLAKKSPSQKTATPCRRCKRRSLGARSRCSQWISPSQIRDLAKKWIRYLSTKTRLIRPWFSCLWFVVGGRRSWRECADVRTRYILHTFFLLPGLRYPCFGRSPLYSLYVVPSVYLRRSNWKCTYCKEILKTTVMLPHDTQQRGTSSQGVSIIYWLIKQSMDAYW